MGVSLTRSDDVGKCNGWWKKIITMAAIATMALAVEIAIGWDQDSCKQTATQFKIQPAKKHEIKIWFLKWIWSRNGSLIVELTYTRLSVLSFSFSSSRSTLTLGVTAFYLYSTTTEVSWYSTQVSWYSAGTLLVLCYPTTTQGSEVTKKSCHWQSSDNHTCHVYIDMYTIYICANNIHWTDNKLSERCFECMLCKRFGFPCQLARLLIMYCYFHNMLQWTERVIDHQNNSYFNTCFFLHKTETPKPHVEWVQGHIERTWGGALRCVMNYGF